MSIKSEMLSSVSLPFFDESASSQPGLLMERIQEEEDFDRKISKGPTKKKSLGNHSKMKPYQH